MSMEYKKHLFTGFDSLGFKRGSFYELHLVFDGSNVIALEKHGLRCPYSNLVAFKANWLEVEDETVHGLKTQLQDLARKAELVMDFLEEHGGTIVPHLVDTDSNPGQRLREAIASVYKEVGRGEE